MTVMTEEITLDIVLTLARQLRPIDKARLMSRLAPDVEAVLEKTEGVQVTPRSRSESIRGILADLGPAPSAEDIDEVRREMWASLTHEDA